MHNMHKNNTIIRQNPQNLFYGSIGIGAKWGVLVAGRGVSYMRMR
jgi:hypothetical protein